jgi:type IV secretion system protein VirD4
MKDLIAFLIFGGFVLVYTNVGNFRMYGYVMLMFGGVGLYLSKSNKSLLDIFSGFKSTGDDTHGSASFAKRRDIKDLIRPTAERLQSGELQLAPMKSFFRNETLYLPRQETVKHLLLCGASGSGKSRSFFLPNCAGHAGSYIATDPKSELWRHVSGFAPSIRFAPRDPDNSFAFNWIPLCSDPNTALLCARALVTANGSNSNDTFWDDSATSLIASIFAHAATLPAPTPASAYDFYNFYNDVDLVTVLRNSHSITAQRYAKGFADASPNTRGSIIATVDTKLNFLADEKVRRFTSTTKVGLDLSALRKKAIRVFWCLAENDVQQLKGLSCLFFTLALSQIRSQDGVPVTLFLDELANIGKIPHLETEIAVVRGRDISIVLGLQSFSQLSRIYGRDAAQVIVDNCATKIFLAGLDIETAEMVSKSLGERTIIQTLEDGQQVKTQRRLLFPDEVRQIDRNEQLIITSNKKPLKTKRFFYTDPENARKMPALPAKTPIMEFKAVPKVPPPPTPPMPDFG